MSSAELLTPGVDRAVRRFAVAWRNRPRRFVAPVAILDHDAVGYRFQYLPGVGEAVEEFRPFIGFPDLAHIYESTRLWPFFDLRVMDRKRPDFLEYVRWLKLSPDASRLDILSRSGGEQKGDSVYLAEEPDVAEDGTTQTVFLVRGSSYAVRQFNTAEAAGSLRPGDELVTIDDVTNEANAKALLLVTPGGAEVGWIPDLLIDYARRALSGGGVVNIVRNNAPAAPWHMRLLVRLTGHVEPGTAVFTGGVWPPQR